MVMSKIYVSLNDCKCGDILAEDINNDKGVTLAAKNTMINKYIKRKLVELNTEFVWLYKPAERCTAKKYELRYSEVQKDYKEAVLLEKQLLNELTINGKLDYHKMNIISEVVYKNVDESNHVARCLQEIRSMDEYTHTHCVNVSFYSMLIAKWLNLSAQDIKNTILAGLLHDVGKLKIPEEILNKKGKLTKEEFDEMKKHTLYGYELIKDITEISEEIKNAVLSHHERIDGTGYPFQLTNDAIGLYAKIIAIADVYDAMTQNRVYKKKVSPFETFQMFLSIGLGIFDTIVLNAFLKNLSTAYIGSKVLLNDGNIGEIAYIPPQHIINPVINIGGNYIDLADERDLKVLTLL